jgi:hypothetical protein
VDNVELVYHKDDGSASPFDARAVEIAAGAQLRLACPYLSLEYLQRLVGLSSHWILVTDVAEWFSSLTITNRQSALSFVRQNHTHIRDDQGLHAKVHDRQQLNNDWICHLHEQRDNSSNGNGRAF